MAGGARRARALMRRYGDWPRAGRDYRLRPGAYGVILSGRRALLVRTDEEEDGEILLPGGGIDPGEGPLAALHRETMEETGLRIRPRRRVGAFRRFVWMPKYGYRAEKICHVYLCAPGRRAGPPLEEDHFPFWADVGEAAALLSIAGERELFLKALRLAFA